MAILKCVIFCVVFQCVVGSEIRDFYNEIVRCEENKLDGCLRQSVEKMLNNVLQGMIFF